MNVVIVINKRKNCVENILVQVTLKYQKSFLVIILNIEKEYTSNVIRWSFSTEALRLKIKKKIPLHCYPGIHLELFKFLCFIFVREIRSFLNFSCHTEICYPPCLHKFGFWEEYNFVLCFVYTLRFDFEDVKVDLKHRSSNSAKLPRDRKN